MRCWAQTERRYGLRIRAVYPRQDDLEALIERQGIDGFYESRAARTACCHVRKIEPLDRALGGALGWIAGLRAEQSAHRRDMALVTAERGLIKLNPIFDWTREKLLDFVAANNIPVNPLHGRGFASIGCGALHPADRPRRARARRPLVVGGRREEGMRAARESIQPERALASAITALSLRMANSALGMPR